MGGTFSNTYGCCTSRRPAMRCTNPHLHARLLQLASGGEEFEEVWLLTPNRARYEQDAKTGSTQQRYPEGGPLSRIDGDYSIVYMYGKEGLNPLSIEWRMDGLGYYDGAPVGGTVVGENASFREVAGQKGSRLKVFRRPVSPKKLAADLLEFESLQYDPIKFNSKHFCDRLFDREDGETFMH
mmetsp:Transcript_50791/g.120690  ORF Transcript_50791/g.120690 Transcript_50791/m.120690 type:complete len:182 (+) Transcript_50791:147-692(+)